MRASKWSDCCDWCRCASLAVALCTSARAGTGFGPTTPPTPAGAIVTGVPVAPAPTVTAGGVSAPVLNFVLTQGSVGLYRIAIQLPANVPTGAVAIQASIGSAQTQAGATIFIGK